MTQGAPRKTRTTSTAAAKTSADDLDLDAWMAKRGLVGDRRVKVGGKWFRFSKSGSGATLAEYAATQANGTVLELLILLLVDPSEKDELAQAFQEQQQPFTQDESSAMFNAVIEHIVASSNVGESSAS